MDESQEDNVEELKKMLRRLRRENISFNEPHFTHQLMLRDGNREEVINHILNPEKLIYSYHEQGSYGDVVHCLHFKVSNTRTLRLPAIFNPNQKEGLYILTYIMRYRPWHRMATRRWKQ